MPTDMQVSALEAESRLSVLLDLVAQGRTVTILRRGLPVARLAPAGQERAPTPRPPWEDKAPAG